jgi:hypothetical protein
MDLANLVSGGGGFKSAYKDLAQKIGGLRKPLPQPGPTPPGPAIPGGGGTSPPPSEVYMVFVKVATHSWCACSEILDTSCSLQPSSASLGELRL